MRKVELILAYAFHAAVLILLLTNRFPRLRPPHPALLKALLSNAEANDVLARSPFAAAKKAFPKSGAVSLVMDAPWDPYAASSARLYAAQNDLAPLLINPQPVEKLGLIDCSNRLIAARRMRETGYRLAASLGSGKGIGIKE